MYDIVHPFFGLSLGSIHEPRGHHLTVRRRGPKHGGQKGLVFKGWRRNKKINLNFGDNFLECCTVVSFILDEFGFGLYNYVDLMNKIPLKVL